MKAIKAGMGICGLALSLTLAVGCGDATDVSLAKVPPVTPGAPETPKQPPRMPKNAVKSPDVLPGAAQK